VYERARRRFVLTIGGLQESELATVVPATPDWSVRDVLAHVVGLTADLNAQRFPDREDIGGTLWGARQVASRRTTPIADIITEWTREAPEFEEGLRLFGYDEGCHFVADLHAHHQDVRSALGLSPDDEPITIALSLDHYLGFVDTILRANQWGTLDVIAGNEQRTLGGAGQRHAVLKGSAFEVLRAFSARRSRRQLRELGREGDLDSLLDVFESGLPSGYCLPDIDASG
jgi:Mycothiol maleylpyruvate isomerase N-terminal domain